MPEVHNPTLECVCRENSGSCESEHAPDWIMLQSRPYHVHVTFCPILIIVQCCYQKEGSF